MTLRLLLSKKDPLQSDFLDSNKVLYTSNTIYHGRFHGQRATTTVTRRDSFGNITQAGTIEWPATPNDRPRVLIRTRMVEMIKTGLYTSPEKFQASDGHMYEWQISNYRPQLVPLWKDKGTTHIATSLQSTTGSLMNRKQITTLFIPPGGIPILDDIIVTFIYFESQWREKERFKARSWDYPT